MDISNMSECPDCASTNIVHNLARDQIVCKDCGLLFEPLAPKSLSASQAKKAKPKAKPKKKKK